MSLVNAAISAARALRYRLTEPLKLKALRFIHEMDYDPSELIFNGPNPRISIYIPTFNRRDLLVNRALKSVLRQTYRNWECIVAAHGCSDGTASAVAAINAELQVQHDLGSGGGSTVRSPYRREIRVLSVPRSRTYPPTPRNHWLAGPVVPANAALRDCGGAWIARLDDDDVWHPEHLEKLLYFAQGGNYELVTSGHEAIDKDGARVVEPYRVHGQKIGGIQTSLIRSYLAAFRFNPQCWRKSHNAVNDTDWFDRLVSAGVRTGYLDEVTCTVKARPGQDHVGSRAYLESETTAETFAFRD